MPGPVRKSKVPPLPLTGKWVGRKTKVCTTCGKRKPISAFYIMNRYGHTGPISPCRECASKYHAERYRNGIRPEPFTDLVSLDECISRSGIP